MGGESLPFHHHLGWPRRFGRYKLPRNKMQMASEQITQTFHVDMHRLIGKMVGGSLAWRAPSCLTPLVEPFKRGYTLKIHPINSHNFPYDRHVESCSIDLHQMCIACLAPTIKWPLYCWGDVTIWIPGEKISMFWTNITHSDLVEKSYHNCSNFKTWKRFF